jgi:hypothetical protein
MYALHTQQPAYWFVKLLKIKIAELKYKKEDFCRFDQTRKHGIQKLVQGKMIRDEDSSMHYFLNFEWEYIFII